MLLISDYIGKQHDETAEANRKQKENQILYQLAAIVGCFFIGYCPMIGDY